MAVPGLGILAAVVRTIRFVLRSQGMSVDDLLRVGTVVVLAPLCLVVLIMHHRRLQTLLKGGPEATAALESAWHLAFVLLMTIALLANFCADSWVL
jgi:hypothetical protein